MRAPPGIARCLEPSRDKDTPTYLAAGELAIFRGVCRGAGVSKR
jgi:hypothetical protein